VEARVKPNGEPVEAPSPEEERQAALLARALEGRPAPGADPESLAAARLLSTFAEGPVDEVSRRRFRRALVVEATPKLRKTRFVLRTAAAAAAVLLAAFGTARLLLPGQPSEALLATREAEARKAVAELATLSAESDASSRTIARLGAKRQESLFETLDERRQKGLAGKLTSPFASDAASSGRKGTTPMTPPTPGGTS
jgi:hypothetical protein